MIVKLGSTLRSLRKKNNYTQMQVADLLFVSRSTYAAWETNNIDITFNKLVLLIEVYHISIAEFMLIASSLNLKDNDIEPEVSGFKLIIERLERIEQLLINKNPG